MYNDIFGKSIEKKHKNERSSYVSFKRVLTEREIQREFKYTNVRENLSHNKMGKDIKSKLEISSKYGDKIRVGLNKLDVYKKGYKDRYNKKTGLAKLDCYLEKKVFDKMDYINGLADKWQKDKKSFITKVFKKYGIGFVLFLLSPALGLIFPILFKGERGSRLISWCGINKEKDGHTYSICNVNPWFHIIREKLYPYYRLNILISYMLLIIVLFVIIYTFIKVIKYEKLKIGKENMSTKEYYSLCKDVFKIN